MNDLSPPRVGPRARAAHAAGCLALAGLVLLHAREVDWLRFAIAFAAIDLAGYLPGAIAFRRAGRGPIHPLHHHLYNLTHGWAFAGAAIAAWALAAGLEWAMLAIPIHLAGDRAVFGNGPKPVERLFEA